MGFRDAYRSLGAATWAVPAAWVVAAPLASVAFNIQMQNQLAGILSKFRHETEYRVIHSV